ncbi:MAG: phosphate propanoyltransferase [Candidatus Paceibacterota bacterium]
MKIKIEISGRHCHLSLKDLETLFGKRHRLKPIRIISQPGQFASKETVSVRTAGGRLDNVRVLGPVRGKTQIEISRTDATKLMINPPVRQSGDLKNSLGAELIGPRGSVKIREGVIIAERHVHCDPKTAKKLKLKDGQRVSIKTQGSRSVTFNNVLVRINKDFSLAFHIDTDEANAATSFNYGQKTEYGLLIIKPK